MGDVRYKPDYSGIRQIAVSPEMHAIVAAVATEAIPFARSISPDAAPYGVGYVDKFEVTAGVEKIARLRRAVAHLTNTASYAVEVEIGQAGDVSRADTGHHVLARVADHIERG